MPQTGVESRLVKARVHVLRVFISLCSHDLLARNRFEILVDRGEVVVCFIVAVDKVEVAACDTYSRLDSFITTKLPDHTLSAFGVFLVLVSKFMLCAPSRCDCRVGLTVTLEHLMCVCLPWGWLAARAGRDIESAVPL
jgi:hypothetical protein